MYVCMYVCRFAVERGSTWVNSTQGFLLSPSAEDLEFPSPGLEDACCF